MHPFPFAYAAAAQALSVANRPVEGQSQFREVGPLALRQNVRKRNDGVKEFSDDTPHTSFLHCQSCKAWDKLEEKLEPADVIPRGAINFRGVYPPEVRAVLVEVGAPPEPLKGHEKANQSNQARNCHGSCPSAITG